MTITVKSSVTLRKFLMVATVALFAMPLFVQAGTPKDHSKKTTVHVPVADLNLSNSAGVEALYTRLSNAARTVCGNQSDLKIAGSLKQLRINHECYENTMARALAEVNFASVAQVTTQ